MRLVDKYLAVIEEDLQNPVGVLNVLLELIYVLFRLAMLVFGLMFLCSWWILFNAPLRPNYAVHRVVEFNNGAFSVYLTQRENTLATMFWIYGFWIFGVLTVVGLSIVGLGHLYRWLLRRRDMKTGVV